MLLKLSTGSLTAILLHVYMCIQNTHADLSKGLMAMNIACMCTFRSILKQHFSKVQSGHKDDVNHAATRVIRHAAPCQELRCTEFNIHMTYAFLSTAQSQQRAVQRASLPYQATFLRKNRLSGDESICQGPSVYSMSAILWSMPTLCAKRAPLPVV